MKLVNIVGARPQFIKLAPVLKAILEYNAAHPDRPIQEILVHTGQHYDYRMSGVFFDELGLKSPAYHLGVGSGTHGAQTGEMLRRIEEVLMAEHPDIVMVYGDTNTTVAGALAAAKLHIPVAHVEAGLRSFNRRMPEEINRVLTDHLSDLLFCPTETAVRNLEREGITRGVHRVGDVMYDAVLQYLELAQRKSRILEQLALKPSSYALATIHRAENTDEPVRLAGVREGLRLVHSSGLPVVMPLHPRTRRAIAEHGLSLDGVRLIEPVSYLDMLVLEKHARVILTDSGGVQKEAFFFGVPCVTLRDETEWVETVETGWNTLVGHQPEAICGAALNMRSSLQRTPAYGDGTAARQVIALLAGHAPRPAPCQAQQNANASCSCAGAA